VRWAATLHLENNCVVKCYVGFQMLTESLDDWRKLGNHFCGLVVRVPCYRSGGLGFDSRDYQIF
jgi:hypothetical protein